MEDELIMVTIDSGSKRTRKPSAKAASKPKAATAKATEARQIPAPLSAMGSEMPETEEELLAVLKADFESQKLLLSRLAELVLARYKQNTRLCMSGVDTFLSNCGLGGLDSNGDSYYRSRAKVKGPIAPPGAVTDRIEFLNLQGLRHLWKEAASKWATQRETIRSEIVRVYNEGHIAATTRDLALRELGMEPVVEIQEWSVSTAFRIKASNDAGLTEAKIRQQLEELMASYLKEQDVTSKLVVSAYVSRKYA